MWFYVSAWDSASENRSNISAHACSSTYCITSAASLYFDTQQHLKQYAILLKIIELRHEYKWSGLRFSEQKQQGQWTSGLSPPLPLTFELSDVVTEGEFRELKENLDRSVDLLNDDMVVKLELKSISSEKVISFSEATT